MAVDYAAAATVIKPQLARLRAEIDACADVGAAQSLKVQYHALSKIYADLRKTAKYLEKWGDFRFVGSKSNEQVCECEVIYSGKPRRVCGGLDGRSVTAASADAEDAEGYCFGIDGESEGYAFGIDGRENAG